MLRPVPKIAKNLPPINWWRAFLCGLAASVALAAFVDIFFILGATRFTMETFLGTLITQDRYNDHTWTIGFFLNLLVGGGWGILYGYFFEYQFHKATTRVGIWLGVLHVAVAAAAILPFFVELHEQLGNRQYFHFGILGSGLGIATPLILILAHLLFGAIMGLFYGPVRAERARIAQWEPSEATVPEPWEVARGDEDFREKLGV